MIRAVRNIGALVLALSLILASSVNAAVTFFTDRAAWQHTQQIVHDFPMTATDVLLALEVATAPNNLDVLGSTLTFPGSLTGIPKDFQLRSLQANSQFTFRTLRQGAGLGAGDNQFYFECDWDITLTGSTPVRGFGFNLIDNEGDPDVMRVYGAGNVLLGSLPGPFEKDTFIGVASSTPIQRVLFDDDPYDSSFFNGLTFGIPEPASISWVMAAAIFWRRNRTRRNDKSDSGA